MFQQTHRKRRCRRYSEVERAQVPEWLKMAMELADFKSNHEGGSASFKKMHACLLAAAPCSKRQRIQEVLGQFKSSTPGCHGFALDAIIEDERCAVEKPEEKQQKEAAVTPSEKLQAQEGDVRSLEKEIAPQEEGKREEGLQSQVTKQPSGKESPPDCKTAEGASGREASAPIQEQVKSEEGPEISGCLTWRNGPGSRPGGPLSLCELLAELRLDGSEVRADVPRGELLLAMAGAHPRLTLDAALAAYLKELLRPQRALVVRPEWDLRPHQEEGYRWLMARSASRFGSVLADAMGLGKTRQAIAWVMGIRAALEHEGPEDKNPGFPQVCCGVKGCNQKSCGPVKWTRALILAPAMLVRGEDAVWVKELQVAGKLFGQPLKVWQWHGDKAIELQSVVYRSNWKGPMIELFDFVLTSYESFLLNQEQFVRENWTCVVLDEAQSIKNHATQTAAAVKRLSAVPFRLALTGSPIENSPDDLHSILQFTEPDCAGTLQDFRRRFPSGEEGESSLRRLLQTTALRREAGEARQMVPLEEVEIPVKMAPLQEQLYEHLAGRILNSEVSEHKRLRELELVCTHPWCYHHVQRKYLEDGTRPDPQDEAVLPGQFLGDAAEQSIEDSGKLVEIFHILRGVIARREKALIFFCRTVTGLLLQALIEREFGFKPGMLRGETPMNERERSIRDFRAEQLPGGLPQPQFLLLSVWVGAVGLNLPEARWILHAERVWNPALERQATARAHRLTSAHPVKAYCLYTEATVEERKRAVLSFKHRLSSHVMDALDQADDEPDQVEGEGVKEREADAPAPQVRAQLSGEALRALLGGFDTKIDEGEDFDPEPDGEESEREDVDSPDVEDPSGSGGSSSSGTADLRSRDTHPRLQSLRPAQLPEPIFGKYGDPRDEEVWTQYVHRGSREVHPKAPSRSTACLYQAPKTSSTSSPAAPLTSRASRIADSKAREDIILSVALGGGASCRLFVPKLMWPHFKVSEAPSQAGEAGSLEPPLSGKLSLREPRENDAPFPIFMPSFGRSAVDAEVGLLDLTETMKGSDGQPLDFLQIVAVKPSEVEKYRMSAPFFVVMELPPRAEIQHYLYGKIGPQDLGVGCARHWLVRLASTLELDFIFMLDDSVRAWKGVTLVNDSHSLLGLKPGPKAQWTPLPMGRVLQHFAEPEFLRNELPNFAAVGFARASPDLLSAKTAFKRAHVYSAFILNVAKAKATGLNFRQDLYVWEDLHFNMMAKDVCKTNRFAMVKKQFRSGGCSAQVARSANPIIRVEAEKKLSPEEIAAIALGDKVEPPAESSRGKGRGRGKGKKKGSSGRVRWSSHFGWPYARWNHSGGSLPAGDGSSLHA